MFLWCLGPALAAEPEPVADQAMVDDARLAALEAEVAALRDRPAPPASASTFNPSLTAFGDVLATLGVEHGEVLPGSGPWLRSLELDLRASVDPFANAVAVVAIEQEPPDLDPPSNAEADGPAFSASAEEVYVDFVALPAGLSVRAGGFRQPFGVTNRAHPHDYPWPDTPAPLVAFLGEEGLNDVGATLDWRVPNPWGIGLTFTGGANAGNRFDPDGTDAVPAWIGRGELFVDAGKLEVGAGASATGQRDSAVVGGDLLVRWRASTRQSVVLLGELLGEGEDLGGYGALQLQPTRALYLGGRVDWLDDAPLQAGGFATLYTSEFLRFRAGAMVDTEGLVVGHGQLTFVWGSHPVEPYWVNR
jgi:hypothetical protein